MVGCEMLGLLEFFNQTEGWVFKIEELRWTQLEWGNRLMPSLQKNHFTTYTFFTVLLVGNVIEAQLAVHCVGLLFQPWAIKLISISLYVPIKKEPGWWVTDSFSTSLCCIFLKSTVCPFSVDTAVEPLLHTQQFTWGLERPSKTAGRPVPPNRLSPLLVGSGRTGDRERKRWRRTSQCTLRKLGSPRMVLCLAGAPSTLKSVRSLPSARPSPSGETDCLCFSFH